MLRKVGKRHEFRDIHFWAEDGRIIKLDTRKNPPEKRECSRKEFLLLAQARSKERDACQYPDERTELQNMIEAMIDSCKEAKEQGDQYDRSTWKWRLRSAPVSVMMPSPAEVKAIEKSRQKPKISEK